VDGGGAVHEDDLALITRHLSIRPGSVLDVGCGPGHLTAHLRSLEVDATGVDPVPEFIDHARRTYPDGRYELGSMERLDAADHSLAGVLAWYSLIHLVPNELDAALAELRRVIARDGTLVAGFFDGDHVETFDHQVTTAYYWPADEFSSRLARAGFSEVERVQRPGIAAAFRRPHGAIAAIAV
jgi:ubiquinone/menaquinone biosynthesis C-methylase UbiE